MVYDSNSKLGADGPRVYQIRLRGHLDDQWSDWFEGLTITTKAGGDTLLTGPVLDDAALHGLLKRVRDLGMSLMSVNPLDADQIEDADNNQL